ncbi:MAG: caspase family protein [Thermoplasmatales archaeon]|nr:MAG: caspase family protein [Thermoplasmatales archaeon]
MRKKILAIGICIGMAAVIILSTLSVLSKETNLSFNEKKFYAGPKQVYEIDKGKPTDGPPGQNNKPNKPSKDDEPQPDPSTDKWAVVIGISNYRGRFNDLQYCDDDALEMYNYLISNGYPEGNINLLLDGEAKSNAIISAIDWLNSWEGPESEVVFFYSGHGTTYDGYDDGDGEYTDEAIISSDLYLILDGQLQQMFSTFESQKISFTFDSCLSGGMNDLEINGRVIVTACGEYEDSYETSYLENGVFTYYYMDELNNHNIVEDAYTDATPLAHNFVLSNFAKNMNPKMYDQYDGLWSFLN